MCNHWGLASTRVNAIVTDNASNMVAAVRVADDLGTTSRTPLSVAVEFAEEPEEEEADQVTNDDSGTTMTDVNVTLDDAIRLTGWKHVRCLAHTINLVVQSGVKPIDDIRAKARSLVAFFHRSTVGAEKLIEQQKLLKPDKQPLKLIVEVSTRWNSAMKMMERLVAVEEALLSISGLKDCDTDLTRADYDLM